MKDYGSAIKAQGREFIASVTRAQTSVDKTMVAWQGSAATAAAGRTWADAVAATKVDDVVDGLGDVQIMWGHQLAGTKDRLLVLVDNEAPAAGMRVSDDGHVTPPKVPVIDGDKASAALAQAQVDKLAKELERRIKQLLTEFGDGEGRAADAIYIATNLLNRLRRSPLAGWGWLNLGVPGQPPLPDDPNGTGPRYVLGRPTRPHFDAHDQFKYNSKKPTAQDYRDWAKWKAILAAGRAIGLDDGTDMYAHYQSNKGTPKWFDYAEGYREDATIKKAVDAEIAEAAAAADRYARSGHSSFSITGDGRTVPQVSTNNWQRTIGSYQQWSHSNVRVEGNRVVMDVTVEAADRYNFNRNQQDVGSGLPDNANGRFAELGWAKPFDTHGSITKTVSWEIGHPPPAGTTPDVGSPVRNLGAEDRSDNRNSASPTLPR
ncbi:MAG: hypothetical protein QM655_14205 [Nocardioidaceae bacterium]